MGIARKEYHHLILCHIYGTGTKLSKSHFPVCRSESFGSKQSKFFITKIDTCKTYTKVRYLIMLISRNRTKMQCEGTRNISMTSSPCINNKGRVTNETVWVNKRVLTRFTKYWKVICCNFWNPMNWLESRLFAYSFYDVLSSWNDLMGGCNSRRGLGRRRKFLGHFLLFHLLQRLSFRLKYVKWKNDTIRDIKSRIHQIVGQIISRPLRQPWMRRRIIALLTFVIHWICAWRMWRDTDPHRRSWCSAVNISFCLYM